MKKKGLVILATLLLCASFTACGKSSAKSESQVSSSAKSITSSSKNNQTANVETLTIDENSDSGEGYTVEDYNFLKEHISQLEGFVDLSGKSYKTPEERLRAVKMVGAIAYEWQRNGDAEVVNQHDNYVYVKFSNGMTYYYYPMASDEVNGGVPLDTHVSIYSIEVHKDECAERKETEIASTAATDDSAAKIAGALKNFTWDHNLDNKDVTLREAAHIGQNKFVLWHGHGAYFEEDGPCLVLEESIYDHFYFFVNFVYLENDGKYLITPEFVKKYFKDMTGTFIYTGTCSGLRDNRLAEAFSAKNTTAIVLNTDVVSRIYACNMMTKVVDQLVAGDNLDTAMAVAKETYGAEDPYFFPDYGAIGHAVPTVYKGGDYRLFPTPTVVFTIKDNYDYPVKDVTLEYSCNDYEQASQGIFAEKTTLKTDITGRSSPVDVKAGGFIYRLSKEGYELASGSFDIFPKDTSVYEVTAIMNRINNVAEVNSNILADGIYLSDKAYTGGISDSMSELTINTSWGHYDENTYKRVEDYPKQEYHIPISTECTVSEYYPEYVKTGTLAEMIGGLNEFIQSGNQAAIEGGGFLPLIIVVKNNEIVEFRLSS